MILITAVKRDEDNASDYQRRGQDCQVEGLAADELEGIGSGWIKFAEDPFFRQNLFRNKCLAKLF